VLAKKTDNGKLLCLAALIYILVFQSPLEEIWAPFSYIDEVVSLLGFLYLAWEVVVSRNYKFPKYVIVTIVGLVVFSLVGLLGNVLYRYQSWKSVVIDLYTNLKFFFALLTGCAICSIMDWAVVKKQANIHAKIAVGILFAVFLFDRFVPVFPGAIRYGIRSAVLFYSHPTYLAGATAFLASLLMTFYEKKNLPFIAMSLTMLMFTLRSKAFASVAIFVALFVFFVLLNRRMKFWHVAVAAAACVIIAWPQISYYFIELGGLSTRSVMHSVAFQIARDYFPIGTGFGTYASAEAAKAFSPVYELYNFEYLLRFEVNRQWLGFLNDTFWPIIIGQTGVIGTIAYVTALGTLFAKLWKLQNVHIHTFAAVIYIWGHLLICSTAEPAFNNSTAIPLAIIMGMALCAMEKNKFTALSEKERYLWQKES